VDGVLDLGVAPRLRHLDPRDEVGDDMRRLEDFGGVHHATNPLIAPHVARLARANPLEELRIPHLVVGMIDLRACRLEPLD